MMHTTFLPFVQYPENGFHRNISQALEAGETAETAETAKAPEAAEAAEAAVTAVSAESVGAAVSAVSAVSVEAIENLPSVDTKVAGLLKNFSDFAADKSIEDLQELFTGTFDMDPDCALDLGWHLFGEDRRRGVFLIKLRKELSRHRIAET